MVVLFICLICGVICVAIRTTRGGNPTTGFLWGVLLGMIGIIVVLLTSGIKCPHCKSRIVKTALVCPHCRKDV